MGVGRGFSSSPTTAIGSTRPPASTQSSLFRGYLVDSPDRRGMAISARRVSFALDLLAAAQAMGRRGRLAERLAYPAGSVGPRGTVEVRRSLSRRQLRAREKGGFAVGKTKRGKGTKWMVLADGEGAAGSSAGKCLSGRSYACGRHTRGSPRPPTEGSPTAKARPRDRRQRIRFRPPPRAVSEARHRTDRALSQQQPGTETRRRLQTSPL